MKKLIHILNAGMFVTITSILSVSASSALQAEEQKNPDVFATVNGSPLSMNLYHFLLGSREEETMARQAYDDGFDAQMHRRQTAEDLVMTELLAQHAKRSGMHEIERVKVELAMAQKTLLAQIFVKRQMDMIEIDESEIRAYYDQQTEQAMYRFMIWQTPGQDRATEVLSALKAGNDAGVSEQDVIETPWLRGSDISAEVNEIVRVLDVNEFAEQPVFQDGVWKVVQVIDKQVMAKQDYEEQRDIIRAELVHQKLDEKLEELASEASIVFNQEHANQPMK
jgi:hypothetical protein